MSVILLCDNGSTRPNATLQLRKLASQLSKQTGHTIHPVSLQHANKIAEDDLNGVPAQVFTGFLEEKLAEGETEFVLLPLFFGESKALTKFVPDETALLKQKYGDFSLKIADVVYPLPDGEPLLTEIICDHIYQTADRDNYPQKNVVLVDHGSPLPSVTQVRLHLAQTVQEKLGADIHIEQAVMERREGKEYDFNGDLLEQWLTSKAEAGEKSALVILMFFLPGRHAGEGGDIEEICHAVMDKYPDFKVAVSQLITEHEKFISILASRIAKFF